MHVSMLSCATAKSPSLPMIHPKPTGLVAQEATSRASVADHSRRSEKSYPVNAKDQLSIMHERSTAALAYHQRISTALG